MKGRQRRGIAAYYGKERGKYFVELTDDGDADDDSLVMRGRT
jgi:hypothetical protein